MVNSTRYLKEKSLAMTHLQAVLRMNLVTLCREQGTRAKMT
jgi:hypothetical protein